MTTGVVVDFNANLARFTGAIDKATSDLNRFQSNADRVAGNVKGIFSKLGVGLSIAAVTGFTKGIIDAADALNDMSKSTGVAVETLAGFKLAAAQSGVELDTVARGIQKFSAAIFEGSDATAASLSRLGLSLAELKGQSPEDQFFALAQALEGVAKEQRPAVLIELLGVKLAGLVPLLDDGASGLRQMVEEGKKLNQGLTDLAPAADAFNDQLDALKQTSTGLFATLVKDSLPSLTEYLKSMKAIVESGTWLEKLAFFTTGYTSGRIADKVNDPVEQVRRYGEQIKRLKGQLDDISPFLNKIAHGRPVKEKLAEIALAETGLAAQEARVRLQNQRAAEKIANDSFGKRLDGDKPTKPAKAAKGAKAAAQPAIRIQNFFDVENAQLTAALDAQKSIIETAHQSQLITDESYWFARGQIANLALDAEKAKLEKSLTEQQDLIKRLGSSDKEKTFDANQKVLEIQSSILTIEQKRAVANFEIAAGVLATNKELEDQAKTWIDLIDPVERYRKKLDEIDKLQSAGKLNADQATEARFLVNEEIDGLNKVAVAATQTKSIFEELGATFTSAFEDAIVAGGSFSDILKGLEKDIVRIITRYATEDIFSNLFPKEGSKPTNNIGGAIDAIKGSDFFSSIASFFNFADGGIMTANGPRKLKSYAMGGVANSPQFAQFGEGSMPEAFVPLPDGRNIPVKMQGRGGSSPIIMNISTPDANSFRASQGQITAEMSRALRSARRNL